MEELLPAIAHRVWVDAVLLEHFVNEPRIGARDLGGGIVSHEESAYRCAGLLWRLRTDHGR